jgi:tripartite-type tricarboxylate transporter receptor subunit TctC
MTMTSKIAIGFISAATVMLHASAIAQSNYPSRPIKIVASAPPGGAYDFVARAIANGLQVSMGQPVIVENKAGAGGTIGTEIVAKSPADGYTLIVGSTGPFAVAPSLYPQLPYDPTRDFAPIARLVKIPSYLIVNPQVLAKSVSELIALAKAKPGKLTYGSAGTGLSQHTNMELFKSMTGTSILGIGYKGSAPANVDLLSGTVDMMIELGPQALPFIKAGKLRVLGVSTATRSTAMPDVPTISESGVPGFDAYTWFALYAPAGTPKQVVDRLHDESVKALNKPDVAARLATYGAELALSTPAELAEFQASELKKWTAVVKSGDIKAE